MGPAPTKITFVRRAVLQAGLALTAGAVAGVPGLADAADIVTDDNEIVRRLVGGTPIESDRIRLDMPKVFGNGYSVPLQGTVDSPMTMADYVESVHVLAPRNPIITVARFHFTPKSGRAALSTRIRLAEPQFVCAVAEMNDGALLITRAWVKVDTDGCS